MKHVIKIKSIIDNEMILLFKAAVVVCTISILLCIEGAL